MSTATNNNSKPQPPTGAPQQQQHPLQPQPQPQQQAQTQAQAQAQANPTPPPQRGSTGSGLRTPSNRKTIYDRNLNRSRTAELSRASFAFLFAEMVIYAQKRVTGIQDLERRFVHPYPPPPKSHHISPPAPLHLTTPAGLLPPLPPS